MASTVQSTHRGGGVYGIYSAINTQGRSLCHLQYNQHTGEESMPSTVQSTQRGGVYAIYSTLNTQGMSLCHLQYNKHTGEESMLSTVQSTQRGGVYAIYSTINKQGGVYAIYSTILCIMLKVDSIISYTALTAPKISLQSLLCRISMNQSCIRVNYTLSYPLPSRKNIV